MNCDGIYRTTSQLILTETWLTRHDTVAAGAVTPDGYSFKHSSRTGKNGVGVGVIFESSLAVLFRTVKWPLSFECSQAEWSRDGFSYSILVIYRPPSAKSQMFFAELIKLLDEQAVSSSNEKLCCWVTLIFIAHVSP